MRAEYRSANESDWVRKPVPLLEFAGKPVVVPVEPALLDVSDVLSQNKTFTIDLPPVQTSTGGPIVVGKRTAWLATEHKTIGDPSGAQRTIKDSKQGPL